MEFFFSSSLNVVEKTALVLKVLSPITTTQGEVNKCFRVPEANRHVIYLCVK
jgi:hypothetical protein